MENWDLYCDESGNSGGNYLDPQQPVYVLAGWAVERNRKHRIDRIIERFKEEHYPTKSELKSIEILGGNLGQNKANVLFEKLGQAGCIPFFIIAEKKYCVAGKIVEAFFDSENNSKILPAFSWMNGTKKNIAEIIYKVTRQTITDFAVMHKEPTIESIRQLQVTLMNELEASGFGYLSDVINGSSEYLHEILYEEELAINSMPEKAMHSLNLPTFISFIQLVEHAGRLVGHNFRVFHDETKQFQEAYPEVFKLYKNSRKSELVLENGTRIIMGFKAIKHFGMAHSHKSSMVQAADLLAGFINKISSNIILNKKISPEMKKAGTLIAGSTLLSMGFENDTPLKLSDIVGSQDFVSNIFNKLTEIQFEPLKLPDINIDSYLRN